MIRISGFVIRISRAAGEGFVIRISPQGFPRSGRGFVSSPPMSDKRWLFYALGAAAAASILPILAKMGMHKGEGEGEVDPVLATALRSIVMMVLMLTACSLKRRWDGLPKLHFIPVLMILLSGAAGAVSWLCGFEAYALAPASKVAPLDKLSVPLAAVLAFLLLRERPSDVNWAGILLIAVGAYLAAK